MTGFTELSKFRDKNHDIEQNLRAGTAKLSDGRDGVVIYMGSFNSCVSVDGAFRLATQIVSAIEKHKEIEGGES